MGRMEHFEKPEIPIITIHTEEYKELVRKAALYDEIKAGRIVLVQEQRILGNSGQK